MNQLSRFHFLFSLALLAALSACTGAPDSSPSSSSPPPASPAREILFDNQWKFHLGDLPSAQNPTLDDAAWRSVDLPHDWSIEGPFSPNLAAATAFLPAGIGWYRKSFNLPTDFKSKLIAVRFDGVYKNSSVWINGHLLGKRPYGYSTFTYDLTRYLNFNAINTLAVQVDHSDFADSRWYPGSGIYRNVFLEITDPVHITRGVTFVSTPKVTSDAATVDITCNIQNELPTSSSVKVIYNILNSQGRRVASSARALDANVPVTDATIFVPHDDEDFEASLSVPHPELWSLDHPAMYTLQMTLWCQDDQKNWRIVDTQSTPFGIRSIHFDPNTGFSLNSQSMKIKGVCLHEDAGALGSAIPIEVWQRRLQILKEGGINAIRTSHNPPAPEFLDLCDRMGFLVMDEAFDEWTRGKHKWVSGHNVSSPQPPSTAGYHSDFNEWSDIDLRDMILRDRNHPSIILWSIGNEIDYTNDPFPPNSSELPPIAARLITDVKALDTSRPVTAACAFPQTNLFVGQLDVAGYNYMERLYAADHARLPNRILLGSENSHTLAAWQAVENNDFVAGQFLWTGIDYLGEASRWPNRTSGAGLLDLAGFKKPQFYFRQSLWSDKPMVYITDQRTFGRRGGGGQLPAQLPYSETQPAAPTAATQPAVFPTSGPITITCYSNCQSVELFLNDKSLGEKAVPDSHTLTWSTPFPTGATLRAVGKNTYPLSAKAASPGTFTLKKSGPATQITAGPAEGTLDALLGVADIIPNPTTSASSTPSLHQIEVHIADAAGTPVTTADNSITVTLTGPAHLLGIENGDPNSHENYQAPTHHAFQGALLLYVQTIKGAGPVTLTLSSPALSSTQLNLAP